MTDMSTTQISTLRQLIRQAGQAQRPGYGLAGVLGDLLLVTHFALFWFRPAATDALATQRAALLAAVWIICLPIFTHWYARIGRVSTRLSQKEKRQLYLTVGFMLLAAVVTFFLIPWVDTQRGWPATGRSLLVVQPLLAAALLQYLTRHSAAVLMSLGLIFLADGLPPLDLALFHGFRTLPVLLAACTLLLTGAREHWQHLRTRRQLVQGTP